eukprot:c7808_g1_i1 orf=231-545(+)
MARLAALLLVTVAISVCVQAEEVIMQAHGVEGLPSRKLQEQIGHACGHVACIEVYYDTAYAICQSKGDTRLPAYTNCCVLKSCVPRGTGCVLHLNSGADKSCGF